MVKYFISIVSHGHENLILNNKELREISKLDDVYVVIKDNIGNPQLEEYCKANSFHYINSKPYSGFGYNNNLNFNYCIEHLNIAKSDYFLIINPDVIIDLEMFELLMERLKQIEPSISTVQLYLQDNTLDNSRRKFPTLFDYFNSFLFKKEYVKDYDKVNPDWIAGSFQIFKKDIFEKINGFDDVFFMYCEDIDICWRANKLLGVKPYVFLDIKAIHLAARENRKLFSKHFLWHLKSIAIYLFRTKKWYK